MHLKGNTCRSGFKPQNHLQNLVWHFCTGPGPKGLIPWLELPKIFLLLLNFNPHLSRQLIFLLFTVFKSNLIPEYIKPQGRFSWNPAEYIFFRWQFPPLFPIPICLKINSIFSVIPDRTQGSCPVTLQLNSKYTIIQGGSLDKPAWGLLNIKLKSDNGFHPVHCITQGATKWKAQGKKKYTFHEYKDVKVTKRSRCKILPNTRGVEKMKQRNGTACYQQLVGISGLAWQSLYLSFHVLLRAKKKKQIKDQIFWVNVESQIKPLIEYSV